jgi:SAM-dependent methyltransferase
MDDYQSARLKAFSPWVRPDLQGVEIGAGYRPTFPRSAGYNILSVDHCPTDELIRKYTADASVPRELVEQIEPVDIVWTSGSFEDLPELQGKMDYVAACHVIEHATDVLGFVNGCAKLLRDDGVLLLAIPERHLVLDCCRPPTTVGDVLLAHLNPTAYDVKSRVDEAWYGALLDGGGAWTPDHLKMAAGQGRFPVAQHEATFAAHAWNLCVEAERGIRSATGYRDAHRWVFDTVGFEEIARFLHHFSYSPMELCASPAGFGCEFYAVLRKRPATQGSASGALMAEARDRVLRARAART